MQTGHHATGQHACARASGSLAGAVASVALRSPRPAASPFVLLSVSGGRSNTISRWSPAKFASRTTIRFSVCGRIRLRLYGPTRTNSSSPRRWMSISSRDDERQPHRQHVPVAALAHADRVVVVQDRRRVELAVHLVAHLARAAGRPTISRSNSRAVEDRHGLERLVHGREVLGLDVLPLAEVRVGRPRRAGSGSRRPRRRGSRTARGRCRCAAPRRSPSSRGSRPAAPTTSPRR